MHDDLVPALPAGFVTNLISPQASMLYKVSKDHRGCHFYTRGVVSYVLLCMLRAPQNMILQCVCRYGPKSWFANMHGLINMKIFNITWARVNQNLTTPDPC